MDKSDIIITYEVVFELLMREKSREELQKLSPAFFKDVVAYLREKEQVAKGERLDVFSAAEREKVKRQLVNIKKMLVELYEKREKKLLNLSLIKSRTPGAIIDTSSMLEEERHMFEMLIDSLDSFRDNVISRIVQAEYPMLPLFAQKKHDIDIPAQQRETKLIRFITQVPKFVGKELEIYGPFDEEDVANLPFEIADILIRKGKAEEVVE